MEKKFKDFVSSGETGKIRTKVLDFMETYFSKYPWVNGIDLGYGGDALTLNTIAMDMPQRYGTAGDLPQQLFGYAENLNWFANNVFDYVYSSHLLEDFQNTNVILKEWLRILTPNGLLALYLPHELRFRETCNRTGQPYNFNHKIVEMSLDYMRKIFVDNFNDQVEEVYAYDEDNNGYSFLIIVKKK